MISHILVWTCMIVLKVASFHHRAFFNSLIGPYPRNSIRHYTASKLLLCFSFISLSDTWTLLYYSIYSIIRIHLNIHRAWIPSFSHLNHSHFLIHFKNGASRRDVNLIWVVWAKNIQQTTTVCATTKKIHSNATTNQQSTFTIGRV